MMMMPKMIIYMKLIIVLNLMIIILFSIIKTSLHPLVFIVILIIYILNMLMLTNMEMNLSIYVYMIFISMISGLMVMFMYFTSLINNFKMTMLKYETIFLMIMIMLMIFCAFYSYWNHIPINFMDKISFKNVNSSINKIYKFPNCIFIMISITYLIYCLNLITKMSSIKFKSLRKIKN